MTTVCEECLYKVVAPDGQWCYMFVKRPEGVCKQLIAWKAVRDFIGKLLVEAMSYYGCAD